MRATIETIAASPVPTFDGQFIPHDSGLSKPINVYDRPLLDLLPGVSEAIEHELRQDAHIVYEGLKLFDKIQRSALLGDNDEEFQKANETEHKIADTVIRLLRQVDEAKRSLVGDKYLNRIETKLQAADIEIFSGERNPTTDEWVLHRLSKFDMGVTVGTDVDRTLTTHADYLQYIPGSVQAENYMAYSDHGRDTFPLVFARYWRETLTTMEKNYSLIGSHVPLRAGVPEFINLTEQEQIPLCIISANFRPFIDGVMNNLPVVNNIYTTIAVEVNDINATDKSTVIRRLASNLYNRAFIYIGDGKSDLPAMDEEARKVVACYFALEGSEFATQLEAQGLPYYTYRDFRDITAIFQRLGLLPN